MGLRSSIKQALEGKYFNIAVDLGCGPGRLGEILKPHIDHLIGVDRNYRRLNLALKFSGYDECIQQDILKYELPPETEAVFMFEVIEHLPREDGITLLNRISHIPFILMSTPAIFFLAGSMNHHVSLWSPEDFANFGFKIELTNYDFPVDILRRMKCIFAVKDSL